MNVIRVSTGRDQPLDRDALSLISVPITARGEKLGVLQLEAGTAAPSARRMWRSSLSRR
ncbi:MAG: hypothetical protein ACLUEQ_07005 [Cloacibacillus evryensis]